MRLIVSPASPITRKVIDLLHSTVSKDFGGSFGNPRVCLVSDLARPDPVRGQTLGNRRAPFPIAESLKDRHFTAAIISEVTKWVIVDTSLLPHDLSF